METTERDERLGEAVEAYLELAESGPAPDIEDYAAGYPELGDELLEALEGLSLMRGLVGTPGGQRLEAGRRLAGYRIVRELGAGAWASSTRPSTSTSTDPVALKVLDARALHPGSRGLASGS